MQLWLLLLTIIVSIISLLLGFVVATPFLQSALSSLVALALMIPRLALTSRRLHDSNHRAWWMLLWVIPQIIATILLAISMCVFIIALAMRFPDIENYFSEQPDGSLTFQMPAHPTENRRWWDTLGLTRQEVQTIGIAVAIIFVTGLLLYFAADIIQLIFMLLDSKTAGMRFDDPRLPMNQTVTYEAFIAWKKGYATPSPTGSNASPQQPNENNQKSVRANETPTVNEVNDPKHPSPDQHK